LHRTDRLDHGSDLVRRPSAAGALLLLVTVGCAGVGGTDASQGVEESDSAGVTIVVNRGAGAWRGAPWTAEQELRFGGDDAVPPSVFGRIADLDVDGAGRLYVLDQLAREVRVFDPDGRFLRRMGRRGEGPGEFGQFVNGVIVLDGTVVVADWTLGRLTTFDTAGGVISTEPMPVPGVRSWWVPDGDHLAARLLRRTTDEDGRWRGVDVLVRSAPSASRVDTILTLAYPQSDLGTRAAARVPLIVNSPFWTLLPDGGVAWSTLEWPELRIHDARGALTRIVRRDDWLPRPVDDAVHAALVAKLEEKFALLGADPAVVSRLDLVRSTHLPVVAGVLAGPDGTIWVQRTGPPDTFDAMAINAPENARGFGGPDWDVFDAGGRFLGTVTLPAAVRVARILGDRLYGIARDSLDVEQVVRARIVRP
jgi:6-bladed beta-propeller